MKNLIAILLINFLTYFSFSGCGSGSVSSNKDHSLDKKIVDSVQDEQEEFPEPEEMEIEEELDVALEEEECGPWCQYDVDAAIFDTDAETIDPCILTPGMACCSCKENNQCNYGFCVETASGKLCTKKCYAEEECQDFCGENWGCELIHGSVDNIYICIPKNVYLCKPCLANTDCASQFVESNNVCVSWGSAGAFCSVSCAEDKCPGGFKCELKKDINGVESNQCVPEKGECECTDKYIKEHFGTKCYKENTFGKCTGMRYCDKNGLSLCDAKEPEEETCNQKDDNCDNVVDPKNSKGCTPYFKDDDGDGFGIGIGECLCKDPGKGYTNQPGDCNDGNDAVHPGSTEMCNGIDDDCDKVVDNPNSIGCEDYCFDGDGDGFCIFSDKQCLCYPMPPYDVKVKENPKEDCDDTNGQVYPGSDEFCDGIDNNCNGEIDEGAAQNAKICYWDDDKDGYGDPNKFNPQCACKAPYPTELAGDCDDHNALINPDPKTKELCNGLDDDCDTSTDEGSVEELCGSKPNATVFCQEKCKLKCTLPWHDVNGDIKDGCECQEDANEAKGGDICSQAIDLGVIPDSGFKVIIEGNVAPTVFETANEDEDWYKFQAPDLTWNAEINGCDLTHVRLFFIQNPDNYYLMSVNRGSCGDADNICKEQQAFDWATVFYQDVDPSKPGKEGECPCSTATGPTGPGEPDMNACTDNSTVYYIKITRDKNKTPTCEPYKIEISNALYKFPL